MSRSFKRKPKLKDKRHYKSSLKKLWNSRVRHSSVVDGNMYKKINNDRDFEDDSGFYQK